MGIMASQPEQSQFVQGLHLAREAGWSDVDIARTLCVSSSDFKNMLTEHKRPSPKHISRLNGLLKSSPPKSIAAPPLTTPPPAPSRPVLNFPQFNASKADIPKGREPLFIGDDGGQPRGSPRDAEAAPAPTEPPKERTEMTTTETVNGMSNGVKTPTEDRNARYRLLSASDATALREAMNKAFLHTYDTDLSKMARALNLTASGLRKTLHNRGGSISEQTRNRFAKTTGWTFSAQPEKERPTRKRTPQTKKPSAPNISLVENNVKSNAHLPPNEMKVFRKELAEAVERAGNNRAEVARGMGVNRNTVSFILNGKGTTYDTLERFRKYIGHRPAEPSTQVPRSAPAPSPMGELDLYAMAGRLLAAGRPGEAHVLSLVARVTEVVPLERVTEALNHLLPYAAAG